MNVSDLFLYFLSYVLQIHNSSVSWQRFRKYLEHFDTSNSKGECGFPKHTADNVIVYILLLKSRKDSFNILKSIAPQNSWESLLIDHYPCNLRKMMVEYLVSLFLDNRIEFEREDWLIIMRVGKYCNCEYCVTRAISANCRKKGFMRTSPLLHSVPYE